MAKPHSKSINWHLILFVSDCRQNIIHRWGLMMYLGVDIPDERAISREMILRDTFDENTFFFLRHIFIIFWRCHYLSIVRVCLWGYGELKPPCSHPNKAEYVDVNLTHPHWIECLIWIFMLYLVKWMLALIYLCPKMLGS